MLNVYTKCIQVCTMFNHVYTLSNTHTQGYIVLIYQGHALIYLVYTRFWPDKQEIQNMNKKHNCRS